MQNGLSGKSEKGAGAAYGGHSRALRYRSDAVCKIKRSGTVIPRVRFDERGREIGVGNGASYRALPLL